MALQQPADHVVVAVRQLDRDDRVPSTPQSLAVRDIRRLFVVRWRPLLDRFVVVPAQSRHERRVAALEYVRESVTPGGARKLRASFVFRAAAFHLRSAREVSCGNRRSEGRRRRRCRRYRVATRMSSDRLASIRSCFIDYRT